MKKKLILACVTSAIATSPVFADSTGYNLHSSVYLGGTVGMGLGAVKDNFNDADSGFQGVGGTLFIGKQFTPYFGVEADYIGVSALFVDFNMYGVLVRGTLPLGNRFSLYAKAGMGAVDVSVENIFNTGASVGTTDAAALIGAGASLAITKSLSLNLDYSGAIKSNSGMDGLYGVLGMGLSYYFE